MKFKWEVLVKSSFTYGHPCKYVNNSPPGTISNNIIKESASWKVRNNFNLPRERGEQGERGEQRQQRGALVHWIVLNTTTQGVNFLHKRMVGLHHHLFLVPVRREKHRNIETSKQRKIVSIGRSHHVGKHQTIKL